MQGSIQDLGSSAKQIYQSSVEHTMKELAQQRQDAEDSLLAKLTSKGVHVCMYVCMYVWPS